MKSLARNRAFRKYFESSSLLYEGIISYFSYFRKLLFDLTATIFTPMFVVKSKNCIAEIDTLCMHITGISAMQFQFYTVLFSILKIY